MKINLIYNGKTGFTKRYADWIAQELSCSVLTYKELAKSALQADDIVIYGSRVFAGKIEHLDKIKAYCKERSNKNLIVFVTGATPASAESAVNKIWLENFSPDELDSIPHFYMPSGLNYEKMGFIDRTMLKTVANVLSKKKDKTDEEKEFEQTLKGSYDISSKEHVKPLVTLVKGKAKAD